MGRRLAAVILSVLLLTGGWLGLSGFPLLAALVPLLWISRGYDASRRAWWGMFGWALLAFALWNAATVWWIWYATPVGPFAATLASSTLNMIAFMLFHTVSKRAPKALAYTVLVSAWIATEYWYTVGEFSWPWLLLGNGFSHEVWAVQWYEYTGIFGGTLWTLVANILLFEALVSRRTRRIVAAAAWIVLPLCVSLTIWFTWRTPAAGTVTVTLVQPNVDPYKKFEDGTSSAQMDNLLRLAAEAPADADYIVMPETAVPGYYYEPSIRTAPPVQAFARLLAEKYPTARIIAGFNTLRIYLEGGQSSTARHDARGWYDVFNSALEIDSASCVSIHHKGRLVIGAEKTPLPWLFRALDFLVIDLGGTLGQIGVGTRGTAFTGPAGSVGPAICYEGMYGDFFGDFVRRGAQAMLIISNDGWWGDTPGYKHLFTISRLRAIEHRRAIARSANTGISGFISPRGDIGATLGWDVRGTLTGEVPLMAEQTFYTRYRDYLGRISEYVLLLSVLYYMAYRIRRRNHLVP